MLSFQPDGSALHIHPFDLPLALDTSYRKWHVKAFLTEAEAQLLCH
jgi:hypothetical protein